MGNTYTSNGSNASQDSDFASNNRIKTSGSYCQIHSNRRKLETSIMPPIAPFPVQWEEKWEQQPMSPIELAFQLETAISTWDAATKKKIEPLINWVHVVCVRSNAMNQEDGSQGKFPWRYFYFIIDSSFKWASSRLDSILGL